MLNDRLTTGYELFQEGKSPKIIVSGDHGRKEYDEVNAMKSFLKEKDVPPEDIFMVMPGLVHMKAYIVPGISFRSKR